MASNSTPKEASPFLGRPKCRYFKNPESCPEGSTCKFAHETKADSHPEHKREADPAFRNWLYMIPQDLYNPHESSEQDLAKFFQQALRLVETNDHAIQQQVVTKLASDGGLQRIKEMAKYASFENLSPSKQAAVFDGMICPFYRLLAWKGISQSLILEESVHRIVNFFFGPGGQRGVTVFNFTTNVLLNIVFKDSSPEPSQSTLMLEAFLTVFDLVIKLNQTAQIVPEFVDMTMQLVENLDHDKLSGTACRRYLLQVQRRLNIGSDIPEASQPKASTGGSLTRPTFNLRQDAPGWLSEEGPRHDNDFDDITKIQIMPTADEIRSPREEYLPRNDLSKLHLPGVQGLIDRQFRLLREDTVGQLRDAVRLEIEHQSATIYDDTLARRKQQAARTHVYRDGQIIDITANKWRGLQMTYEFGQPAQGVTIEERRMWWDYSKRLQNGALVCLVDPEGLPLFCSVSEWEEDSKTLHRALGPSKSLFQNVQYSSVKLSLVNTNIQNIDAVVEHFAGNDGLTFDSLIEFPGVMLAAFAPTLAALQSMSANQELPFGQLIAPGSQRQETLAQVAPPAYSLVRGFYYDLSCLTSGREQLLLKPQELFDLDTLRSRTTLDVAQARALVDALTRSLALVQGPPGTGKSFTGIAIIKVLIASQKKAKMGPIICVTYTNHALDQLLEHLIEAGVEQIIRVGSRSKSELLENLTLRHIKSNMEETKTEKARFWELRKELDGHVDELKKLLQWAKTVDSVSSMREYLEQSHPHHFNKLFSLIDEDGFQKVQHRPENIMKDWSRPHPDNLTSLPKTSRPVSQLLRSSLLTMSLDERAVLYQYWLHESRDEMKRKLGITVEAYVTTKALHDKVKQELDLRALEQAKVIGVTTSGLARIVDLLRRLESKVLVCEEAGEILESHTLTALLPTIEHAIFIGDHLQLRPQTQNYQLQRENPRGKQYSLDVSLFERLVDPQETAGINLPYSTLEIQRRMHPSVSRLISQTLYPSLIDHECVKNYPEIPGMRRRLFWLDHQHPETPKNASQPINSSHSNDYEVEMTASLVSHLIKQSVYQQGEIAVLTPYLGQLQKLRRRLSQFFEVVVSDRDLDGLEAQVLEQHVSTSMRITKTTLLKAVRVATVDDFQGEEAEVIVISLVRSNEENKCGFLRTSNRINVLLSRAKHGMYIVGNSNTSRTVPMWDRVVRMLEEEGSIGQSLELSCVRHPDTPIAVASPDDFSKFAPEGGCALVCAQRLSCGHRCKVCCHSEILHSETYCAEPCNRSLNCNHPCPKSCGDVCPKCAVPVKTVLPSGHIPTLPCWQAQQVDKVLWPVEIGHKMAECGHKVTILCGHKDRVDLKCTAICNSPLPCGHLCKKSCEGCASADAEPQHGLCTQVCGRPYTTCKHTCPEVCHDSTTCGSCQAPCEVKCSHSTCNKKCHEPCAPCAEDTCESQCPHSHCSMPCAAPCDWIPCSQRCPKALSCGHRCPSVCGEVCPDVKFCQICAPDSVEAQPADLIMLEQYGDIDLDEDPCIFPNCGHVFTLSSLDGTMHMTDHYDMDSNGKPFRLTRPSAPFAIKDAALRTCPHCRGSLRMLARHGRIVRRSLLDESHKKFIVWSNHLYGKLAERMELQEKQLADADSEKCFSKDTFSQAAALTGTRENQMNTIQALNGSRSTMRKSLKFLRELNNYLDKVRQEEQPYHRVWELVKNAQRRGKTKRSFDLDDSVLQTRCVAGASAMVLRWELSIISKVITGYQDAAKGPLTGSLVVNLETNRDACRLLILGAESSKHPSQQVEGHLLFAKYAALECTAAPAPDSSTLPLADSDTNIHIQGLREEGNTHLDFAEELCRQHPAQTRGMQEDIESVCQMLRGSTFYSLVTNEERLAVIRAMASEFSGTGHWYYCTNGHPFTIGECGMPMQLATCPQCGAQIGGRDHEPVDGTTRADDWDGGIEWLRIG